MGVCRWISELIARWVILLVGLNVYPVLCITYNITIVPGYLSWLSLMAKWLDKWHEMYCHDLKVMCSNPGWVELGVLGTSVLSCTWIKIFIKGYDPWWPNDNGISSAWKVLCMIWKSWVWIPIGSNIGCVVLLSESYLNQKYVFWPLTCWSFILAILSHTTPLKANKLETGLTVRHQHVLKYPKYWSPGSERGSGQKKWEQPIQYVINSNIQYST